MALIIEPKKKNKKEVKAISALLDNETFDKMEELCNFYKISKAELVRQFVLQEFDYLKEKGKIGD
jgi:hypothetical protein